MKKNQSYLYLIIILLITASIFGYLIYSKLTKPASNAKQTISTTQTNSSKPMSEPTPTITYPSFLSATDKSALKTPGENAPDTEKIAYYKMVSSLAKPNDVIEIESCFGKPSVSKIQVGKPITIKNNDNIKHQIIFDQEQTFVLEANSTQTLNVKFKKGAGLYGFGCDKQAGPSALILVES